MNKPMDFQDATRERTAGDPHGQTRIRAAWLYHVEGMTQSEVAKALGVNRIMIARLLSEARKRGEVVVRIKSEFASLVELERKLELDFGIRRVIVAPFSDPVADPTKTIAAAAGQHVSSLMDHNLTVGVGWGRTLHTMLPFIEGKPLSGVRVISLLGGIAQARRFNPAEFAWQFAELFDAEGYLVPAPAIVDSAQTKHTLLEHCGLDQIFDLAENCDVALLSCGGISNLTTSYRLGHVSEGERISLKDVGAVGDILYNFLGLDGARVDHPVNDRSVCMPIERLTRVNNKILISGGPEKTDVLRASILALKPTTFITDEQTAIRLLSSYSF